MQEDFVWNSIEKRYIGILDPTSRNMEIMLGIIMAISFTSTVSIAHEGQAQIKHLLWAVLGCNIAWGIIDGITYIINGILERARKMRMAHAIRNAKSKEHAIQIALEEIPPMVGLLLQKDQLLQLYDQFMLLPPPKKRIIIVWTEIKNAGIIFFLNFFGTLPVAIPFILMTNPINAKYVSDCLALIILFYCGYSTGKYSGLSKWKSGIGMILIGFIILAIGLLLGG